MIEGVVQQWLISWCFESFLNVRIWSVNVLLKWNGQLYIVYFNSCFAGAVSLSNLVGGGSFIHWVYSCDICGIHQFSDMERNLDQPLHFTDEIPKVKVNRITCLRSQTHLWCCLRNGIVHLKDQRENKWSLVVCGRWRKWTFLRVK